MEEEVAEVRGALDAFAEKLDKLESATRPVIAALDELRAGGGDDDIPPLVRARVDATLAYALSALFCMYLRTQGQDPLSHPVREEIGRVRAAYVRIHDVTSGEKGRPRKRAHAKLHFAESELTKVLTDAERELHHAVNGVTTKESGNGKLKKFDSSEDEEDHTAVNVVGKVENNEKGKKKKEKRDKKKEAKPKKKKSESSAKTLCESSSLCGGGDEEDGGIEPTPELLRDESVIGLNSAGKRKKKRKHNEGGASGLQESGGKRKSKSKRHE
jgi:hypothetical protein